ncbi:hypothetical protein C8R45DRAFT_1110444 [Mycena sanguinolenta]|nr:hypothetical protein C8R45DRAFT_1110444 [Mycena sanguinolenta]
MPASAAPSTRCRSRTSLLATAPTCHWLRGLDLSDSASSSSSLTRGYSQFLALCGRICEILGYLYNPAPVLSHLELQIPADPPNLLKAVPPSVSLALRATRRLRSLAVAITERDKLNSFGWGIQTEFVLRVLGTDNWLMWPHAEDRSDAKLINVHFSLRCFEQLERYASFVANNVLEAGLLTFSQRASFVPLMLPFSPAG